MPDANFKHLNVKVVDGVAVVDFVNSQLMFEAVVIQEIGGELSRLITDHGHTKILLDFTHVQYLSSPMIAQLAKLGRQVQQVKGRLKLCGLGPVLRDTFRIAHLESFFDIQDDAESAIKSFQASGRP
jgi:anti-sigma B factor antagonist